MRGVAHHSVARPVRACVPAPTPLSLELSLERDGHVAGVTGMADLPVAQQLCVAQVLQHAGVSGGLSTTGRARYDFP